MTSSGDLIEKPSSTLETGLALFSMFFGAGNLIFPLLVGEAAGANNIYAVLGLGITAVAFPFLGLIAMMLFNGDYKAFFGRLGTVPGALLFFLLQALLGPFGVIPRLVTLMHATLKPYFSDLSLPLFSVITCATLFFFTVRPRKIIRLLGWILTPIFLISLALLIVFGLTHTPEAIDTGLTAPQSFLKGLLGGYNTMDLIAAFLFATAVLPHLRKGTQHLSPDDAQRFMVSKMIKASLIAVLLLLITYVGLSFVSAHHTHALGKAYAPEDLLGAIAFTILGPTGAIIASITIVLACLTTAISLVSIFSQYVHKEFLKGRPGWDRFSLYATLLITGLLSNLGFSGIAKFLGPLLQVIYPGLILFSLLNIIYKMRAFKPVKTPVYLFLTSTALFQFTLK